MQKIDVKNCLYHGIINWENYLKEVTDVELCLEKFKSILRTRYIYMPNDFEKHGIKHTDCANDFTRPFTFVACHPDSKFSKIYGLKKCRESGYLFATFYSDFGFLFSPNLLNELEIVEVAFCSNEILLMDNISLDKYCIGVFINPEKVSETTYNSIYSLLKEYGYDFNIFNVFDGTIIESYEKEKVKKLVK